MKNLSLIIFSGIDSSGKSTQIDFLYQYLIEQNCKKVKIIWSRVGYTPLFNTLKIILRFLIPSKIPSPGESIDRQKTFSKKWVRKFWINISLLDLFLYYVLYFRFLNLLGYTIIADRYIWDSYIDLILKFGLNSFRNNILFYLVLKLSPKTEYNFLLTIPAETSLKRSDKKQEPFSENLDQRKERINLYNKLKMKKKWKYIIPGDGSMDEVANDIKSKLQ